MEAYRDLVDNLSVKNLPIGFATKSLVGQSFNPTLSSSDARSEHQTIDPIKDIETASKEQEAIILFELLSLNYVEKLKIDQSSEYAKDLISIINSSSSEGIPQSIELDGHNFSRFVSKVNVYLRYNYGEFAQLIFICALKIDANQKEQINNAEDAIGKRKNTLEKIQKEIESQIPTVMHGFYFNNELLAVDKPFKLPSLYVYNANIFSPYLKERTKDPREVTIFTPANDTIRGRADSFVEMFQTELDKPESNTLNKIGIYPELLLALIDSLLIISHDTKYFLYELYFIVCNYVALNFQKTDLLHNKTFLYFIFEFSLLLHIDISFIKMRISLDKIELPLFVMNADEEELINQKLNAHSINAQLDSIDDLQYKYHVSIIAPFLEKNASVFIEEKRSTYLFGKYVRAESLSDHFRTTILENSKKLNESISYKRERITRYLESLNSELQLIKDKPVVNSFLKDVEMDLVKQIRKWEGKISKQNIEEWLLNFDSRSDKLLALKILDKISYVTYQDLFILSRQLYKRIKSTLGDIRLDECAFSYVGHITSGSVHIVRLFQEQNKIERNLFVDIDRISEISSRRILFLLDDFVGSGNTFIQWFNETLNGIIGSKFDRIYYCVLTAFDKGVKKVEEQTKIQTISAYLYEQSSMIIDGNLFNDIEKEQIRSLIGKYRNRLPNRFLYGYDDCQLLVAFESNIPNNSISLLWGTECWTPLLERK